MARHASHFRMVKPEKHRGWLTGKAIRQPKEPKKRVIGSGEEPIGCEKTPELLWLVHPVSHLLVKRCQKKHTWLSG